MFHNLGPTEMLLILLVVVLLFGAKKLPDLARGAGQGLRIFKDEVKGDPAEQAALESRPAEATADPAEKKHEQQG